jgi:hypothetical protein
VRWSFLLWAMMLCVWLYYRRFVRIVWASGGKPVAMGGLFDSLPDF